MRIILIAATVLFAVPVFAQTNRFEPGNPWYFEFERDCRQDDPDNPMHPECQKGVIGAWQESSGSPNVRCDFGAFWAVSDELKRAMGDTFEVLPWQYGVESVLQEGVVCWVAP